jgi:HTH-type transcriptional regulator, transcriptional repressor of NAD biosynthesis genes
MSIKKIVLFGSESTGKSTLAAQLAEYYQTVWVPEFAREYLENEKMTTVYEDIIPIAQGQMRLEDEQMPFANKILFCDTDILETKVYSESYFNKTPDWLLQEIENRRYDFYLLTDIDLPWVADGLRDRPHRREEMHTLFLHELLYRRVPFVQISGTQNERLQKAIKAVDGFLQVKK